MSKFTKSAAKPETDYSGVREINFMDGTSYRPTPLSMLRIIAASSIFGEPQYYRDGISAPSSISRLSDRGFVGTILDSWFKVSPKDTADLMEKAIDDALDFDFGGTLALAKELRLDLYMRLNPAVIIVRAAIHPKRVAFTNANPGAFRDLLDVVAKRPDDLITLVEYFISKFKSKSKFPNVLKKAIAAKIAKFDRYQLNKHANKGIGLVDVVRITHATGPLVNELMREGKVTADQGRETWRELKSGGASWNTILEREDISTLTHQDLLFQMRNILNEANPKNVERALDRLVSTAKSSMVFPYRYIVAERQLASSSPKVLEAMEKSLRCAIENQPKLRGRVMSLCDNSGSAWGAKTVEGSSIYVAEIGNLSAELTAHQSEEGYVGVFGDRLETFAVSKYSSILDNLRKYKKAGTGVGHATENGIWLFWDKAIRDREHWDTVFIYSDMQAGHGQLYGTNPQAYRRYGMPGKDRYIDVLALVKDYRKRVNPKVNVFSVQIAGYGNSVLPEMFPRAALLAGWTGKEAAYAHRYINEWDNVPTQ